MSTRHERTASRPDSRLARPYAEAGILHRRAADHGDRHRRQRHDLQPGQRHQPAADAVRRSHRSPRHIHIAHRLNVDEPGWGDTEISYRDFLDFRGASSVEGIGGYLSRSFVLSGDDAGAERIRGGSVTPDLFPLLGIEPVLGRQFRMEEAAPPGLESVVMLTHGLWQRRYGGDPAIIGKSIIVNDRARVVIGVMPHRVPFPGVRRALHAVPLGRIAAVGAQHQRRRVDAAGRIDRTARATRSPASRSAWKRRIRKPIAATACGSFRFATVISAPTIGASASC